MTHTLHGHLDLGDGTLYYETAGTGVRACILCHTLKFSGLIISNF